jgi:hypothetical protein
MNPKRFPSAKVHKDGVLKTTDTLSIFHTEAQKADAAAFMQLLQHLRGFDEEYSTVIMVQVENEVGLLGDSRDRGSAASQKYAAPVPRELTSFLSNRWHRLHPDLKKHLDLFQYRSSKSESDLDGSWDEIFGKSLYTDELFMAYHYALCLNQVAEAGRKEYPIPLYTNVWMNNLSEDSDHNFPAVVGGGGEPGDYPSGGGVPNVLDVWQNFAPALDLIAPDIYLTELLHLVL